MGPVDFVFERFGYLLGDDRTGWLSGGLSVYGPVLIKPSNSGAMTAGMVAPTRATMALYVSDSEVLTLGTYGYPHKGVAHNDSKIDDFAKRKLVEVPTERWVLIWFGKAEINPEILHLNMPEVQMTAWTRNKERVSFRPADTRDVYAAMKASPIKQSKWYGLYHLYLKSLCGALKEYERQDLQIIDGQAAVRDAFNLMIARSIPMGDVLTYGRICDVA